MKSSQRSCRERVSARTGMGIRDLGGRGETCRALSDSDRWDVCGGCRSTQEGEY